MLNVLPVIFAVMVVVSIVFGVVVASRRNRRMDEANDAYRTAAREADAAIFQANQKLQQLHAAVGVRDITKADVAGISLLIGEYQRLFRAADGKLEDARKAHQEAYDAYTSGVMKQNIFLGGANDMSAFSLHRRTREFQKIRVNGHLINPSTTLVQAYRILDYHGFMDQPRVNIPERGARITQEENGITGDAPNEEKTPFVSQHLETFPDPAALAESPARKRRRVKRKILLVILLLALFGGYFGYRYYASQPLLKGEATAGGLTLSIDQHAVPLLRISYANGSTPHTLGWARPSP